MARPLLIICAVALASCAPSEVVQSRPYELVAPAGAGDEPLPLLVVAHGYGLNGAAQDVIFGLSAVVEAKRFLLALPNGTVDATGRRFWNATEACCGAGPRDQVDDVAFFRALVDDVKRGRPVREGHVYVAGHSNGAFMGLRLACEASDVFAGVVSLAGSTFEAEGRCGSGAPVAVLLAQGDRDASVPLEGRPGSYPGTRETARRFAARNGCTGGLASAEPRDLVGDARAETTVEQTQGCPASGAVDVWVLEGQGHLPFFKRAWAEGVVDWLEAHAR